MGNSMISGAVLGSPVSHSLSPLLHRSIFSHLDIPVSYEAIEVSSGGLHSFLDKNQNDFDYFSLTMPLKEEALSLAIQIDPLVHRIQSANTLVKRKLEWSLYSTDGIGFLKALEASGYTKFNSVLVLGAGGTARAVVGALDDVAGRISVLGRSSTRSAVLEAAVNKADFSYLRWSDTPDFAPYDLIVNTTPAGAADVLANSVTGTLLQSSSAQVHNRAILFDVIYKPWPTVLASRWRDSGGTVINGSEMLLYQGIAQAELVLGRSLDYEDLAAVIRPILSSALN
jgi:shikimate dehydrogenase